MVGGPEENGRIAIRTVILDVLLDVFVTRNIDEGTVTATTEVLPTKTV